MAAHPEWSRRQLSVAVAWLWNWRTAAGQLRDMAVRHALNKLHERGFIELPARQKRGGQRSRKLLLQEPPAAPVCERLHSLRPLQFVLAEPGTLESRRLFHYLHKHRYLGCGVAVGQKLASLARDSPGRDLAGLVFSAAAWRVQRRDQFIGWTETQRQRGLPRIVNNICAP